MRFVGRRATYFQEFIDCEEETETYCMRKVSEHVVLCNNIWDFDDNENPLVWPVSEEQNVLDTTELYHDDTSEIVFVNISEEEDDEDRDNNPQIQTLPIKDWEMASTTNQRTSVGKFKSSIRKSLKSMKDGFKERMNSISKQTNIQYKTSFDVPQDDRESQFTRQVVFQQNRPDLVGKDNPHNNRGIQKQSKVWNFTRKIRLRGKKMPTDEIIDRKTSRYQSNRFVASRLEEFADTDSSSDNSMVVDPNLIQFSIPDDGQQFC
jgi:hypothetical protein